MTLFIAISHEVRKEREREGGGGGGGGGKETS